MSFKYIKNTDDATIICKIPSDKKKEFIFRTKKFDKRNNVLVSNGFTEVSDEDIALLRAESNTFQYYEKKGKLSVADSLPPEAMNAEQLVASLKMEIASLKRQLQEAPKEAAPTGKIKDVLAELAEQKKIIEEMTVEAQKQQDIIDELQEQLAETVDLDEEAGEEVK